MRAVPNVITVIRMLGSFLLLLTVPLSPLFFGIYLLCGMSDMLDGYLARKWQVSSPLGATLDSIGDCVFVLIALYMLLPVIAMPKWVINWIGGIFFLKGCTFALGYLRYGGVAFLHTYLNKIAGAMLFCFPMLYGVMEVKTVSLLLCTVATLAAGEEFLITASTKELHRDRKGLFFSQK